MKLFKKAFLLLLFLAALGAIAILAALFIIPQTDLIKNNLQDQLSVSTGHQVKIGRIQVRPSIPQLLTIQVEGFSIPGASGRDLISAGSISFRPSWWPLFTGELSISSIKIYDLKATIQRAEDGSISDFFCTGAGVLVRCEYAAGDRPK